MKKIILSIAFIFLFVSAYPDTGGGKKPEDNTPTCNQVLKTLTFHGFQIGSTVSAHNLPTLGGMTQVLAWHYTISITTESLSETCIYSASQVYTSNSANRWDIAGDSVSNVKTPDATSWKVTVKVQSPQMSYNGVFGFFVWEKFTTTPNNITNFNMGNPKFTPYSISSGGGGSGSGGIGGGGIGGGLSDNAMLYLQHAYDHGMVQ